MPRKRVQPRERHSSGVPRKLTAHLRLSAAVIGVAALLVLLFVLGQTSSSAVAPSGTWKTYPELGPQSDYPPEPELIPGPSPAPAIGRQAVGLSRRASRDQAVEIPGSAPPPSPIFVEPQPADEPKVDPQLVPGCVGHTNNIVAHPGDLVIIEAAVVLGTCSPKAFRLVSSTTGPTGSSSAPDARAADGSLSPFPSKSPVDVLDSAGKAKLLLVSPLFPGQIDEISEELQDLKRQRQTGAWAWEVRPDKPGIYKLSLILSVVGDDETEIELTNKRIEVTMRVDRTFAYTASSIWSGISSFLTSLSGLIMTLITVAAGVLGVLPKLRKGKAVEAKSPAKAKDDAGYM